MTEPQKPVEQASPSTVAEAATEAKRAEEAPAAEPQNNNRPVEEASPAQPTKEGGVPEEGKRKSFNEKKEVVKPTRRSSKEGATKRKSTRKSVKGDDLDDDEEEIEEVPKIIYPIDEKIQQTLRTAWTLLVKKNQKKKTEISDTQARSQDLATCSKGFLTYENFEQRLAETLKLQPELWIRKGKEEILAALHTICEYNEQIEAEKFKKLLMTKGDVMTDPEGSMMLRVARDRDTRMVYLDEYGDTVISDLLVGHSCGVPEGYYIP